MDIEIAKSLILIILMITTSIGILLLYIKRREQDSRFKTPEIIAIICIIVINIILSLTFQSPIHLMYTDEPRYIETSNNIIENLKFQTCELDKDFTESCTENYKATGWTFLLSLFRIIFGYNSYFMLNILIKTLSAIILFSIIARRTSLDIGFMSSIVFSILPVNILWASTVETNTISILFILLQLEALFSFIKNNDKYTFLRLTLLISLSTLFRPELIFMGIVSIIAIIHEKHNTIEKLSNKFKISKTLYSKSLIRITGVSLITLLIILELLFGIYFIRGEEIALSIFFLNIMDFLRMITLNYLALPIIVFLVFYLKKSNYISRIITLTLMTSILIYLPIYTESRVLIVPSLLILLLISLMLKESKSINLKMAKPFLFILLIIGALTSIPEEVNSRELYEQQLESSKKALEIIPPDCVIITAHPVNIRYLGHRRTMSTENFIKTYNQTKNKCIYFYQDSFCKYDRRISSPRTVSLCNRIIKSTNFNLVESFSNKNMAIYQYNQ